LNDGEEPRVQRVGTMHSRGAVPSAQRRRCPGPS
jgi:hypothetical protein